MIPTTLRDIATVVGGSLAGGADPDAVVGGAVSLDSRSMVPGGLYVALVGERVDGHDFAEEAVLSGGAVAVLASKVVSVPSIIVEDPVVALGLLARSVVDRLPDLTIVGITGSSGKTSTKDLLAAVLRASLNVVAPLGSMNNEIGLPLTLLRADAATDVIVAEMGARGVGHIATLTAIAPPRIGVILNIGTAHLGEFGDLAGVALAKGELVESLPAADAGGVAVLNADDAFARAMAVRTSARVVLAGRSADADVRASDVTLLDGARPAFTVTTAEGTARVELSYVGEHHVANAVAAAAVARELGLDLAAIARGLSDATPSSPSRMAVVDRADGVTVIDDAYNASPDSVRAALHALVGLAAGRRTWAVLGEMRELGEASEREHEAIGKLASSLNVDRVVVVGDGAKPILVGTQGVWVPDIAEAVALLTDELRPGDVVLVKASHSIGLERVAEALLSDGARS